MTGAIARSSHVLGGDWMAEQTTGTAVCPAPCLRYRRRRGTVTAGVPRASGLGADPAQPGPHTADAGGSGRGHGAAHRAGCVWPSSRVARGGWLVKATFLVLALREEAAAMLCPGLCLGREPGLRGALPSLPPPCHSCSVSSPPSSFSCPCPPNPAPTPLRQSVATDLGPHGCTVLGCHSFLCLGLLVPVTGYLLSPRH